MTKIPDISVVVPVFNSEKIIPELIKRVDSALHSKNISYELIFVNDASTDNSKKLLDHIKNCKPQIQVIHNEENLGQAFTSIKGMAHAIGKYIVTIDDDLEYEPEDIVSLYKEIKNGNYMVVFGIAPDKYRLQGRSTFLAKIRNKILNVLWDKPVTDSFKIFNRELAFKDDIFLIKEPFEVFMKKTVKQRAIGYISVGFNKRYFGSSNYTFVKKLRLFLEMNKL